MKATRLVPSALPAIELLQSTARSLATAHLRSLDNRDRSQSVTATIAAINDPIMIGHEPLRDRVYWKSSVP